MFIRVAIFEDNPIVTEAYKALLNGTEGFTCTGSFTHCNNLKQDIQKSQPDVLLMDIQMQGVDGIEATKKIKELFPEIKILIQTVFEDDNRLFAALCAGANGYILKNTPPVKLLEAIRDVHTGGAVFSSSIAAKVASLFQKYIPAHFNQPPDYQLSPREKEILSLLAAGNSMPRISEQLFLSYETIRSYVKSIYQKLHVASATAAVSKALRENIV
jgi:DNA-binding NarL/FixJ family response regulator